METNIPTPFDPEEFRKEGHTLVDTLADYLKDALSGTSLINWLRCFLLIQAKVIRNHLINI
jgi:hypothetical protein